MKELVSVIIPVYNVEAYLRECVDSVLRQTYTELEVILVDDGSTDSSSALCDSYAQADDRVQVIHKENGGQSTARNAGLDQARGQWIMFVDSDDLVDETIVQKLIDAGKQADMTMCSRQKFTHTPQISAGSKETQTFDSVTFLHKIYEAPMYIAVWGKLYKRELFQNFRFKEGIIYEDEDALPQLIYKCKSVAYLDEELYCYRVRRGSTMNATFSKKRLDILWVCEHRIELFTQWGLEDLRIQAVKDYYLHLKRLERQTKKLGLKDFQEIIQQKKLQWKRYNVKFSWKEKICLGVL